MVPVTLGYTKIGGKSIMKRSMKTMDGNHAAAHASNAYTDVAAIYPITHLP